MLFGLIMNQFSLLTVVHTYWQIQSVLWNLILNSKFKLLEKCYLVQCETCCLVKWWTTFLFVTTAHAEWRLQSTGRNCCLRGFHRRQQGSCRLPGGATHLPCQSALRFLLSLHLGGEHSQTFSVRVSAFSNCLLDNCPCFVINESV